MNNVGAYTTTPRSGYCKVLQDAARRLWDMTTLCMSDGMRLRDDRSVQYGMLPDTYTVPRNDTAWQHLSVLWYGISVRGTVLRHGAV